MNVDKSYKEVVADMHGQELQTAHRRIHTMIGVMIGLLIGAVGSILLVLSIAAAYEVDILLPFKEPDGYMLGAGWLMLIAVVDSLLRLARTIGKQARDE
jgi:divalent metal cation (Fe/Co/Zn/Cd) transporter